MSAALRERWLGAGIAAFGGLAMVSALGIGSGPEAWGARTFPMLGGGIMLLAGAAMGLTPSPAGGGDGAPRSGARKAVWLIVLTVVYILAIGRIGYLLATALAAAPAFALFGARSRRVLVAAAVLCPILLYLFFFRLLGVFPPYGAWFDIADYLPI